MILSLTVGIADKRPSVLKETMLRFGEFGKYQWCTTTWLMIHNASFCVMKSMGIAFRWLLNVKCDFISRTRCRKLRMACKLSSLINVFVASQHKVSLIQNIEYCKSCRKKSQLTAMRWISTTFHWASLTAKFISQHPLHATWSRFDSQSWRNYHKIQVFGGHKWNPDHQKP